MQVFYYTFSPNREQPFQDGWIVVCERSRSRANTLFKRQYPHPTNKNLLNCAKVYTRKKFIQTIMYQNNSNYNKACHGIYFPKETHLSPIGDGHLSHPGWDRSVTFPYDCKGYPLEITYGYTDKPYYHVKDTDGHILVTFDDDPLQLLNLLTSYLRQRNG